MQSVIENIYVEGAEIAFVLESPHTDEIFHGYPLAGAAGREMSKYLLERYDIPIGLIAYRRELVEVLDVVLKKPYSVVNVTKQPLQKSAYVANGVNAPADIEQREKLKRLIDQGASYKTAHRDDELNKLKEELYTAFKKECMDRLANYRALIPCGRFARTFCERLREDSLLKFEQLDDIPHPSSGGWGSLDAEELNRIKGFLR